MGRDERKRLGRLGAEFCKENQMTSEEMGKNFIKSMDGAFKNWKPTKRYTVEKI
jgi:hypothetical protein